MTTILLSGGVLSRSQAVRSSVNMKFCKGLRKAFGGPVEFEQ